MSQQQSTSEFKPDWLALREPADAAARSSRLTRLLADRLPATQDLHVLDIATGTGANLRYLQAYLPADQSWLLVDRDVILLDEVSPRLRSWCAGRGLTIASDHEGLVMSNGRSTCRVRTERVDVAGDLDARANVMFNGVGLVTASALLDLVSENWLRTISRRCREARAAALFALTYDGRIDCSPEEPEDNVIRQLVNEHQRTDKGFGAALGPSASAMAVQCFSELGYEVQCEPSDWVLDPEMRHLQQELIEGWIGAAVAIDPSRRLTFEGWRERRLAHVAEGRSRLIVGHQDLAAWLRTI